MKSFLVWFTIFFWRMANLRCTLNRTAAVEFSLIQFLGDFRSSLVSVNVN